MTRSSLPLLDRWAWCWVPLLLGGWLSGCAQVGYYLHLAEGQMQLMHRREPVTAILADSSRDARLRQRLALAQQARAFATTQLHLPDNRSYLDYVQLDRPYVVWNVFATEAFSVEPRLHCMPLVGCVAYRGYYQQGRARGAAALLQLQGLDTQIAGIEAYSTLGWFADPLLSSMLHWDDPHLVGLIFHELAHQQFYLPGDTAFNESFASFVEREGLRQWRARFGWTPPDPALLHQREEFIALVLHTRERLRELYALALPEEQMRQRKQAEFDRLRREYHVLRDTRWNGNGRFDAWINGPLNNARLLPFGLYDQWLPAFAALFQQIGENWPVFYARVRELGKLPAPERRQALEELQTFGKP